MSGRLTVSVTFTMGDVEDAVGRELTDEERGRFQETYIWRRGAEDYLTQKGWELIKDALFDAGINCSTGVTKVPPEEPDT